MAASAPEDEKAEVPDDLEAAPEDAPLELENPPDAEGVLCEGALGCPDCVDWVGAGLLVDQPDELPDGEDGVEGEDGAGAGVLGRLELDQPEEPDRLPPEEKEPPPLFLAKTRPVGPTTSIRATARARIELGRMSGLPLDTFHEHGKRL